MSWSNGGLNILRENDSGILSGANFYTNGNGNERIFADQVNAIFQALRSNYVVDTGNKCVMSVGASTDLSSSGNHLAINSGTVFCNNTVVSVSSTNIDLSSAQSGLSSGQARYVLVHVNSSGTVGTTLGDVATDGQQNIKSIPQDQTLLCMVYLVGGDNEFSNNQIADMRIWAPQGHYIDGTLQLGGNLDANNNNITELGDITFNSGDKRITNEFFLPSGVKFYDAVAGARYRVVTGSFDLTFQKYDADATAWVNALVLSGADANDGSPNVTITNSLVLDSATISAVQTSGETFADNDSTLMTSASIEDRYSPIAGSSSITTVGTISSGTWQGTAIASAYLDSDTAHLSGTQTFSGAKTFTGGATFDGLLPITIHDDDSGAYSFGPILKFQRENGVGFQSKIQFDGWISLGGSYITYANIEQRVSSTNSFGSGWGGSLHFNVRDADTNNATMKSMLVLNGGSSTITAFVESGGIRDLTTGSSANVFIGTSDGKLQRSTSSQRYKTNFQDIPYDRTAFHNVTPRLFESTISNELDENGSGVQRWGLIAEDLQTAFGNTIIDFNDNEEVENYDTRGLIAVMYQEIKNLKAEIDELRNNN